MNSRPVFCSLFFSLVIFAAACGDSRTPAESGVMLTKADLSEALFDVADMTCGSCERSIKAALKKVDGVALVEASAKNGSARVQFDPQKIQAESIAKVITKLGFKAQLSEKERP